MSGSAQKNMSSRLLTMKFMQRAAASTPTGSPSTPSNRSGGPPSKRQRLSSGASTPSRNNPDYEIVQAALAEEEAKRIQALEKHAKEAGETRWVLSVRAPTQPRGSEAFSVTTTGFADIDAASSSEEDDSDSDEESEVTAPGRMRFGKQPEKPKKNEESGSSDDSESEEDYDPNDVDALIANARIKSQPNGTPKSISGGGRGPPRQGDSGKKPVICYKCGQAGHIVRNCNSR